MPCEHSDESDGRLGQKAASWDITFPTQLCKTIFETCEIQELIYEVDGVSFNQ